MKRFLIYMLGDDEQLLFTKVIGELSKDGVIEMNKVINKATGHTGVIRYTPRGTMYNVYEIATGENRKQVLENLDAELLYKARVQKYNEANNAEL